MKIKTIAGLHNLAGKKILVRVDFNVPVKKGKVLDDYKLIANLPFLKRLLEHKAQIILISHLGDPVLSSAGKVKNKADFTLKPVATYLAKKIKKPVAFFEEEIGSAKLTKKLATLKNGSITLLENIRFYKGEAKDDKKFAKQLASLADIYINNAFAVSHRKHASVSAIKAYLPSYAGSLIEEEVLALAKVLKPYKPLVAVVGGAKISTKTALLKQLSKKADHVLVGGILANVFLVARGHSIGKSEVDKESVKLAKKIYNKKIILPLDVVVMDKKTKAIAVREVKNIKANDLVYDIGPETMKYYAKFLRSAQTIVWNGPMGWFEQASFKQGTLFIARAIAERSRGKAFGLIGGGETIEAMKLTKMIDYVDWVSTGGGASITFLGGEAMPGLKGLVK